MTEKLLGFTNRFGHLEDAFINELAIIPSITGGIDVHLSLSVQDAYEGYKPINLLLKLLNVNKIRIEGIGSSFLPIDVALINIVDGFYCFNLDEVSTGDYQCLQELEKSRFYFTCKDFEFEIR